MGLSAQVVTPLEPEPNLSADLRGSPIAKTWKQPKCPLTGQWIKKMWYIHTVEYPFILQYEFSSVQLSSVQFSCSAVSNSLQPHGVQASLSITNSQSLVKLMYIESVMEYYSAIKKNELMPFAAT